MSNKRSFNERKDKLYFFELTKCLIKIFPKCFLSHLNALKFSSIHLIFNILKFCSFLTFIPLLIFLKIDVY